MSRVSIPWIDPKYIGIVGMMLENFRPKGGDKWNCRCPVCGDSATDKTKARGWFLMRNQSALYHCFNCEATMSLASFLRMEFPEIYSDYRKEYAKELYSTGKPKKSTTEYSHKVSDKAKSLITKSSSTRLSTTVLDNYSKLTDLPTDHPSNIWFDSRKLPEWYRSEAVYIDDTTLIRESFGMEEASKNKTSRVGLPIWNIDKSIVLGISCRDITNRAKNKYLSLRDRTYQDIPLLFGLDRLELSKTIFVLEGPLDSLFLTNSCAVGNGGVYSASKHPDLLGKEVIYIFDNQPRHKQVVESMNMAIESGLNVGFWDEDIPYKDINDCILNGISSEYLQNMFLSSPKTILMRKLKFSKWRKI